MAGGVRFDSIVAIRPAGSVSNATFARVGVFGMARSYSAQWRWIAALPGAWSSTENASDTSSRAVPWNPASSAACANAIRRSDSTSGLNGGIPGGGTAETWGMGFSLSSDAFPAMRSWPRGAGCGTKVDEGSTRCLIALRLEICPWMMQYVLLNMCRACKAAR